LLATAQPPAPDSLTALPVGELEIIVNPNVPADVVMVLGNGAIMVPTKGTLDLTTGLAAAALGLPIGTGTPVPSTAAPPVVGGVVLQAPADDAHQIAYLVNGDPFSMKGGSFQELPAGARWLVEFDRGGEFGAARYTLTDGSYRFTPTDKGWELYQHVYKATISNEGNPTAFHYLVNNEYATLEPNATAKHEGKYPILLQFDRGNGDAITKRIDEGATLKVALHPRDNLWELFANKPEKAATTPVKDLFE